MAGAFEPVDIAAYLRALTDALLNAFGDELVYIGLQGSYLRGEATERSDIDVMAVLHPFAPQSLVRYRAVIDALPYADRACGFICGRDDLTRWNKGEIGHLLCSTGDVYGRLRDILPPCDARDLLEYAKLNAGNMYHALCHGRLHSPPERSAAKLPELYRGVFFVLQDVFFARTGRVIQSKQALLPLLGGIDRQALDMALRIQGAAQPLADADAAFALLFDWCRHIIAL